MILARSLEIRNKQVSGTSSLYDSPDKISRKKDSRDGILSRDGSPVSPNVQHNGSQISFQSLQKSNYDLIESQNEYQHKGSVSSKQAPLRRGERYHQMLQRSLDFGSKTAQNFQQVKISEFLCRKKLDLPIQQLDLGLSNDSKVLPLIFQKTKPTY